MKASRCAVGWWFLKWFRPEVQKYWMELHRPATRTGLVEKQEWLQKELVWKEKASLGKAPKRSWKQWPTSGKQVPLSIFLWKRKPVHRTTACRQIPEEWSGEAYPWFCHQWICLLFLFFLAILMPYYKVTTLMSTLLIWCVKAPTEM